MGTGNQAIRHISYGRHREFYIKIFNIDRFENLFDNKSVKRADLAESLLAL